MSNRRSGGAAPPERDGPGALAGATGAGDGNEQHVGRETTRTAASGPARGLYVVAGGVVRAPSATERLIGRRRWAALAGGVR